MALPLVAQLDPQLLALLGLGPRVLLQVPDGRALAGDGPLRLLQVAPEANVAQLRAQLSMLEGVDCEQLNLFISP